MRMKSRVLLDLVNRGAAANFQFHEESLRSGLQQHIGLRKRMIFGMQKFRTAYGQAGMISRELLEKRDPYSLRHNSQNQVSAKFNGTSCERIRR